MEFGAYSTTGIHFKIRVKVKTDDSDLIVFGQVLHWIRIHFAQTITRDHSAQVRE